VEIVFGRDVFLRVARRWRVNDAFKALNASRAFNRDIYIYTGSNMFRDFSLIHPTTLSKVSAVKAISVPG
jgi:hypothetical protein